MGDDRALLLLDLAGNVSVEIAPPLPANARELRKRVEEQCGIQKEFLRFLHGGAVLTEDDSLEAAEAGITLVVDDSAMFLWDTQKNPDSNQLEVDGPHVRCPNLMNDYVNVCTQAPLLSGTHYVEFVMHCKGDEQWCGVVPDKALGWGKRVSGHSSEFVGCFYYCGRRSNPGALQIPGPRGRRPSLESVCDGDIIGLAVDCDARTMAFSRNGTVQAACAVPDGPLYLLTHVDTPIDHVELRRLTLEDAPPKLLEALAGPLTSSGAD
mmetsp:Transcript_57764/g.161118  ORF Transcript_57764/g.161118 Transcript_57764/m.161118 type:complete len:266 (+) Transcript_57764:81-878(+)